MWTRRVYGNSAGSQIRLCFLISTKVMFKNWTYKSLYWVHLLCNNFNRLPLRNCAITTAWVMRQSSDNEKLEEQKKTCMLAGKIWNVQPYVYDPWSGRPLTKMIRLTKKSQNYRYHLRDLAGLSYCSPKTSSSSTPTFLINQTPVRNFLV